MRTFIFIVTIFIAAMLHADDSPMVKAAKANGGPKKPMPQPNTASTKAAATTCQP